MAGCRRTAVLVAALGLVVACRGGSSARMLTYYDAEHGVSLVYPAHWTSDVQVQDEVSYRYFAAPASAVGTADVSVTLVAGHGELDAFEAPYLADRTLAASRDEARGDAKGRTRELVSADGQTAYVLLLLAERDRIYGLYAQGETGRLAAERPGLRRMFESFTIERASSYPVRRHEAFRVALGVPPSWKETRAFAGAESLLLQFTSPPVFWDKGGPAHGSLTLSVETLPTGTEVGAFYEATRKKLGDAFVVLRHEPWKDGFVDLMKVETPISELRVKRYYRVAGGRGYSLALEARDDAYARLWKWCDVIAGTLRIGDEVAVKP